MNKLILKWGTLKGWELESDKAIDLIGKYHSEPVSVSVMFQRDTPKQKDTLLELIEICDEITLDWDGKILTRDEAKDYILHYGENR